MRLAYYRLSKDLFNGFIEIKNNVEKSSIGAVLAELMYLRISQINGCEYCIKVHSDYLLKQGESNERINDIANWQSNALFSEKEKAALNWAESLTNIVESKAADSFYLPLKEHFNDQEISDLTHAIALMNAFNRIAIGLGD
ncbi:carboxymuconolactone decarboxylase family protein [Thiotrichales bacterium 19S11-10]|nr:carboxymuconolactone decarboxylase family protein [Thiotrichales bacterium 19S11-10]